ncbi:MAG TPA: hypothetical protein VE870_13655 [Bacteroidales bacterium]|nr:hypothetical protein [Bacteroidales bacterium]
MKKVLNILIIAGVLGYVFAALSFTGAKNAETVCRELRINLFDTLNSGFYKKADIEKILMSKGNYILGYPLKDINTRVLEKALQKRPYIEKAEIYSSIDGVIQVDITQRKPVVRIITRSQNSYYLDKDGYILPARGNFSPHVLIANGYFTEDNDLRNASNLSNLADSAKYSEWFDSLTLAAYISRNAFWNSQIVQLYFDRDHDFELIPRVGAHQIIFGDTGNMEGKFKKLKVLYDNGLKYEGWNSYEKINLKYKNQVICTKR